MDEPEGYARAERVFARRVKELRDARGMSQADLAAAMVSAGIPYANQSTVSRMEKLSRPVRLIEAQAIAVIFDVTLWELTEDDSRVPALSLMRVNARAAARSISAYKRAVAEMFEAREAAQSSLEFIDSMFPDVANLPQELRTLVQKERELIVKQLAFDPAAELEGRAEMIRLRSARDDG